MDKCFCHFNGYAVKDAEARRKITELEGRIDNGNDNLLVVTLSDDGTIDYPANEIFEHIKLDGGTVVLRKAVNDSYIPLVYSCWDYADFVTYDDEDHIKETIRIGNAGAIEYIHEYIVPESALPGVKQGSGVIFNDTENNTAGKHAVATGTKKTRSGGSADVPGDVYYTEAVGEGSMASGMGAVAFSRASKSLGYRTQTGYPPTADWIEKRNGVTVKVDAQGNNVFPGDNIGQGAVAMGSDTVALENHTFAGGYKSKAIATASFAYGSENVANGNCSVAMGSHNEANEECAIAIGSGNKAQRKWSFAVNSNTEARGNCSSAFGDGSVTAKQYNEDGSNIKENPGYAQMVVGRYNAYENGEIDSALFVVGNGVKNQETGEVVRSNAFIVDRNGNANVAGKLSFGSVDDESAKSVRGIVSTNTLPARGEFDGQICMLDASVDEGAIVTPKTIVYIWSANIRKWIKIAEENGIPIAIE